MNNIFSKVAVMLSPKIDIKLMQKRGLQLGKNVYIGTPAMIDHQYCWLISIGNNCIIAPGVFILAHDTSTKNSTRFGKIGKVTIGSRSYIGVHTTILPGVNIGHDVIIGAGSVVTKDIPNNSVAVGNPAIVIMSTLEFSERHRKSIKSQLIPLKRKTIQTQQSRRILQNTKTEEIHYFGY
jgi:maltose O-acetyltransferase